MKLLIIISVDGNSVAYKIKHKFYPPMPFISAACFIGLLLVFLFF